MKKTYIIFALYLTAASLIPVVCRSQAKSYISLLGGLSAPMGDFGKSDYSNNSAGFAKKGAIVGLDAAVYVYKNLAIAGSFAFQDQGELNATDVTNISNGYTNDFSAASTTVTAVNRYHSLDILLGPQYTFIFKKMAFDIRASAGYIKSLTTPTLSTTVTGSVVQTTEFYQRNSTSLAFGYGASAALRYNFSDKLGLALKGNYIDSDGYHITNQGRTSSTGRLVVKQPVSMVQATLGLCRNF